MRRDTVCYGTATICYCLKPLGCKKRGTNLYQCCSSAWQYLSGRKALGDEKKARCWGRIMAHQDHEIRTEH
jgi:hypothetical protein